MPDPHPLEPRRRLRLGRWLAPAILAALGACFFLLWSIDSRIGEARRMAASVAREFQRAFNFVPEIRVNSTVVIRPDKPVMELATVQRQAQVRYAWSQTWMHSTKRLEIEATFTARAGFDLTRPFQLQIASRTLAIHASLPPPKILSIGMSGVRILADEDGLWNGLTQEDRQAAFVALEAKAVEQFKHSDILAEAQRQAEKRLADLLKSTLDKVEFLPARQPLKPN